MLSPITVEQHFNVIYWYILMPVLCQTLIQPQTHNNTCAYLTTLLSLYFAEENSSVSKINVWSSLFFRCQPLLYILYIQYVPACVHIHVLMCHYTWHTALPHPDPWTFIFQVSARADVTVRLADASQPCAGDVLFWSNGSILTSCLFCLLSWSPSFAII